jgi:hypothetical protein
VGRRGISVPCDARSPPERWEASESDGRTTTSQRDARAVARSRPLSMRMGVLWYARAEVRRGGGGGWSDNGSRSEGMESIGGTDFVWNAGKSESVSGGEGRRGRRCSATSGRRKGGALEVKWAMASAGKVKRMRRETEEPASGARVGLL